MLDTEPLADVIVTVASNGTGEGTPSTTVVTFTAANWNTPQTVTVTGQDDDIDDGDIDYTIVLSTTTSDATYAVIDPTDVSVTKQQNSAPVNTSTPP